MLVISIETINKLRSENEELRSKIKGIIGSIQEKGMPMLDYICLRKKAKINALLDRDEFLGSQVFCNAFEKWRKIFKHSRKKEFKFSHLIKFMQNNKVSEEEKKKAQAKELLVTVRTLL